MRVLLIDDSKAVRMIARLGLMRQGTVETMEASSGEEGIEVARTMQPDAILLDVHMPGIGGRETLAQLQTDPSTRSIPVVFLTADESRTERENLRRMGAQGVVSKPFDPRTLLAQLEAYLAVAA